MTREEAIDWLKAISFVSDHHITEAIDMAIESLQGGDAKMRNEDFRPSYMQETPSEDGSDLISRADAICEVLVNDGIDNIVDRINDLPSAEPKCGSCKHYEPKYDVCHAPELVKQVTSKLKKPCDSLLTDDSAECKEQKSKLESADAVQADDRIEPNKIYCSPLVAENVEVVVRCKDCRYFKKIAERSDSGLCHRDIVASAWKENGYCSRGVRIVESEVEE